jgi:fructoselysine-6-P-deglycase FrlB-like protein
LAYPQRFAEELAGAVGRGLDHRELRAALRPAIDDLLADPRAGRPGRLLFTGSGDSLFAATAALPALRRWSGRPAEVLSSIELARYEAPLLGRDDVVLAVSNSGNSSRTREAVLLSRERAGLTVGVTGSATGPLAGLADRVLHRPVRPPEGDGPAHARVYLHLVEYVATLVTLYELGLAAAPAGCRSRKSRRGAPGSTRPRAPSPTRRARSSRPSSPSPASCAGRTPSG